MSLQEQRKQWAQIVKDRRRKRNLSQEDLARKGVCSLSYIQKIENAVRGNQEIVDALLAAMKNGKRRTA